MDHLCYFCFALLCFHARLFVDALWSPAEKGLTSWLSFVIGILGHEWCLVDDLGVKGQGKVHLE